MACEKAEIRAGYIRRKTLNTYIYKTKKYIIAQILWDLAGVICLAFSPLLQQWLFDYGLQSPSQKDRDGEYVSLQGNDITALEQDYLEPVISIIRCVNMIIVYGAVLFFGVDWRIALVIILTSIFAILIPRMIGKSLTDARSTYQEQMAEYVTEITDLLEGFRVINQMTVGKILDKHEHVLNETAEKRYQYGKKKSMVLGVSELTTKFVKIFTFAVVAVLFYKHEITVGVGVATLSYVSSFIEPIDTVLYNFTAIQSMKDVKKKVLAYTQDTHVTVLPRKKKLNSDITFENVTFKRKSFALENINLTIKKA